MIIHNILSCVGVTNRFWIGWLDLLTPYTLHLELQAVKRYCYIHTLQFTVIHTSVLSLLCSPLVGSWQWIHNSLPVTSNHTWSLLCTGWFLSCQLPTPETRSILCCNCHLFSLIFAKLNSVLSSDFSCTRSTLYSLGVDSQKTPLPLLLHVDSLLLRCVYSTVVQQQAWCGPTEKAACNTSSVIVWHHSVHDTFLCSVCTGRYLATAVSLASQFLLWANMPQYLQ
jgi:hypothetical protein